MQPYYQDDNSTLWCADVCEALPTLASKSVNCVVTSPPYYGLRDYGTAEWEGGKEDCQHTGVRHKHKAESKQSTSKGSTQDPVSRSCRICGAFRIDQQIGLESTPAEYLVKMVAVFREVRRVLRDDGVVWINIGDSYSQSSMKPHKGERANRDQTAMSGLSRKPPDGFKPKDLMMIPARLAIALCDDGWYLRSEIVWAKPNPMPESVTDRPTRSHEMIYLLSKNARYYYNADVIKEPFADDRMGNPGKYKRASQQSKGANRDRQDTGFLNNGDGWNEDGKAIARNRRSVWTISTQPTPEAHFATFPEDIVRPCVLAGCPDGGVVLDPFAGSGTTMQVAREQNCKNVGIELSAVYCELIVRRLRQQAFAFK